MEAPETESFTTSEKGHGREEIRHCMVVDASEIGDLAFEWTGLKTLGYVVSLRAIKGKASVASVKFYISSAVLNAKALLTASKEH